ncbi:MULTISPECIES: hypothetical protein [Olivibacter]|uniref:Uncharacterized protein n=1 Tax=Olivibacter jilunii TaxID=985016 RepID=A0ABW6AW27_9SPHI
MKKAIPYLVILLLVGVIYYLYTRPKDIVTVPVSTIVRDTVLQVKWKDSEGRNHSKIETDGNIISQEDLKDPTKRSPAIDTAAKALNIANNKIQQLTSLLVVSEANRLKAEYKMDSMKRSVIYYSGPFIDITYTPPDSLTRSEYPNGAFGYQYRGKLDWVTYKEQKKLFNIIPITKEKSYTDFFLADTNAYIAPGMKRITIKQEDPNFGVRIQASSFVNPETWSVGVGPALRVDIGRVSIQGQYLQYPRSGNWRWGINTNYDLVRF